MKSMLMSVHTWRQRLHQVLYCVNSDANIENGSEPILCVCVSVIINTMIKVDVNVDAYAKSRVNKALVVVLLWDSGLP